MTLEQLCRLAVERGVQIHIGTHKDHIMANPPVVTVQINDPNPASNEHQVFSMPLVRGNKSTERALEVALRERVDRVSKVKMRMVKTLDELANEAIGG
jgi:hypothetical protein